MSIEESTRVTRFDVLLRGIIGSSASVYSRCGSGKNRGRKIMRAPQDSEEAIKTEKRFSYFSSDWASESIMMFLTTSDPMQSDLQLPRTFGRD